MARNRRAETTIQDEMALQFPGWPHEYEEMLSCWVLDGISTDYPYLVLAPNLPQRAFLIPSSMLCSCSLHRLTKSQRSKMEDLEINIGRMVNIVVSRDRSDPLVKALLPEPRIAEESQLRWDKWGMKVCCIFSDEVEPRCYVPRFGIVKIHTELKFARPWIPNVVYDCRLHCTPTWSETGANGVIREVGCQLVLSKICEPADPSSSFYSVAIGNAPWIRSIVSASNYEMSTFCGRKIAPDRAAYPSAPTPRLSNVKLWYFEGGRVIRASRPRTKVRIMPGIVAKSASTGPYITETPDCIIDGMCLTATLWYNKISDFYLVANYTNGNNYKAIGEPEDQQLTKRVLLDAKGETNNQYLVNVKNSLFHDFYVCDQLGFTLISDPKRLLRNVIHEEHPDGFPVWVRLEPDEQRLAQFSIVSLDKLATNYTEHERKLDHPDIRGHGILVDDLTGAVISRNHPQTRIRLAPADRQLVPIGQQLQFVASFYGLKKGFIVCGIRTINEYEDDYEFVEMVRMDDDTVLFKQNMKSFMRQWAAEGHDSPAFGPVMDPQKLHRKNVFDQRIEWPLEFEAYVCFNTDWELGKDTQMKLHSLVVAEVEEESKEKLSTELELTEPMLPSTSASMFTEYEGRGNADPKDAECLCLHAWGLLKEIVREVATVNKEVVEPELMELMIDATKKLGFLGTGEAL